MEFRPVEVLKWVGVVLAAGFVGYFGRYLAMLVLEKLHRRKGETATEESREKDAPAAGTLVEQNLKLEKKRLKQAAKKAKKEKS